MALTNIKIYLTHDQVSLETNHYRIEFEIPTEVIVVVEIEHGTLQISVVPPETPVRMSQKILTITMGQKMAVKINTTAQ